MADYDTIALFMKSKNEPQPTVFGRRIQAKIQGMSLRKAEKESGISKDTIRRAVFHIVADLEVAIKFCLWLECDVETALDELGLSKKLKLKGRLAMTPGNQIS